MADSNAKHRAEIVLVLVEVSRRFCQLLQERYAGQPNVHVVHGSTDKTAEYLRALGLSHADYVVRGLPFSSLQRRLGMRILVHTQRPAS